MARPSIYSDVIADAICDELIAGRSILKITAEKGFPGETTIYRWLDSNEGFRAKYARARELQADHYAAECIDLADEERLTRETVDDKEIVKDNYNRTRLQIDARKWYASKLAPKKYGERTVLAGDPDAPLVLADAIAKARKRVE